MATLRDIYERFVTNYRTETGGINLYPQFDDDLTELLSYLREDWNITDVEVDCSWRAPEGE